MQKVIAIVGPTSSGKSALGVYVAQKIGGEIISADSRQVYRGLDIGTGKITKKEMAGVPHHLLGVASPKRVYNVSDFQKAGQKALLDIAARGKVPLIVGGTGLYADVLLGRMVIPEVPPNPDLRTRLEKKTIEKLFAMLEKLDPARAKTVDAKNKRRVIRAIEIARGRSSIASAGALRAARPSLTPAADNTAPPRILWIGLNPSQEILQKKIHARLLARIKQGMVAEARRLHVAGLSYKRMESLGLEYRSLARLLQNKITREEFLKELEQAIIHYSKRQRQWFKTNKEIHWVTNRTDALKEVHKFLNK